MARLKVEVVTPEKRLVEVEADEIVAPGADGLFGVRPGHTPVLSVMAMGALTVRNGAATDKYFVSGGFVEVGPSIVRVLADSAEALADVDLEVVKKRVQDGQGKLDLMKASDAGYDVLASSLRRDRGLLDAAARR